MEILEAECQQVDTRISDHNLIRVKLSFTQKSSDFKISSYTELRTIKETRKIATNEETYEKLLQLDNILDKPVIDLIRDKIPLSKQKLFWYRPMN